MNPDTFLVKAKPCRKCGASVTRWITMVIRKGKEEFEFECEECHEPPNENTVVAEVTEIDPRQ